MASKYDANTRAKAIRLVREHARITRLSGPRSLRSRAGRG
jgi:hypothetical protein